MFFNNVEIKDDRGTKFKIKVISPNDSGKTGTWYSFDKGYIQYNGGTTEYIHASGTFFTSHVHLVNSKPEWGVQLNNFRGLWSANESGEGIILQPWVLAINWGRITWSLVF